MRRRWQSIVEALAGDRATAAFVSIPHSPRVRLSS
jgi:hypothetical protein